jgi:hypothetical protein
VQTIFVEVLVGLALLYVLRQTIRTWFGGRSSGCSSGCGKCAPGGNEEERAEGRIELKLVDTNK